MLTALRRLLPRRDDYDLTVVRADLLAGITVAVVALPLALGFGVTSGAGAAAGLVTAVVAGVLASTFGGSSFQISGPTGAMTVVLLPLVAAHGVAVLAPVGLLAGLVLVVLGVARVGRVVRYIPYPVVTGFTAGIAVIIFLQQLPSVLGVPGSGGHQILLASWRTLRSFLATPAPATLVLALLTAAAMLGWGRVARLRGLPASMAALLIGTVVSLLPAFGSVARIGALPTGLPTPRLPDLGVLATSELARAALVIAVLAALESLLSAVVADGMTIDERHDPDRELFGQGVANLGTALVGGIPATAALARTAVNVRSGARTRLAGIVHGLVLGGVMLLLAPLAGRIPLAALGAILLVVAARMVEVTEIREILRSSRSDAATMLVTFATTVLFDLVLAIEIGLIVAGALFVARMARLLEVDTSTLDGGQAPHHETHEEADRAVRDADLVVYRIEGPLFFGAADRFFQQLLHEDRAIRIVVLRMRGVPVMDVTGAVALRSLVERLGRQDVIVMMSAIQEQPRALLDRTGILGEVTRHGDHLFTTTDEAILHARAHLARPDHTSRAGPLGPALDRPDHTSRAGPLGPALDRPDHTSRAGPLGPALDGGGTPDQI